MNYIKRRNMARLPAGGESPLASAVTGRDADVVEIASEAIRHREALLAFQPVMQARPPHETAFYEGLVRVLDATGRVIPARDFVPKIETQEIGRDMDCLTLDLGLSALARVPSLRLSLNMSARSIGYAPWFNVLNRHLRRNRTVGERLMLEIDESSVIEASDTVLSFMERLQPSGIAFALDSYGAGVTALKHLRDFMFDAVKIDGQFVRGIDKDEDKLCLVRALISVAKEFEMLIVAESVERTEEAGLLVDLGVDCLQGFLFGAPKVSPDWDKTPDRAKRA